MKNKIINGNFDIWQRGTSFTSSSFGPDRFRVNAGGTFTISRQAFTLGQTDVPGEPEYYLGYDVTVAGSSAVTILRHYVESVRTLVGKTATLSFWARTDATKTFKVLVHQVFGTGGSPSAGVEVLNQNQSIGAGPTWTRYTYTMSMPSISGKTIGSNGDDYVEFVIQEAPGFSTFELDIAQVQLEEGADATAFEDRSLGEELSLAQRYYFKTFPQGTAPAQNAGRDGAAQITAQGTSLSQSQFSLPVTMRVEPTITFYNPSAANAQIRNHSLATDFTSTFENSETHDRTIAFYGTPPASSAVSNGCSVHITADAEL